MAPLSQASVGARFFYTDVIYWYAFTHMKDAGIRIRVERELCKAFLAVCQAQDRSAAQVLRELMLAYVRYEPGRSSTQAVLPDVMTQIKKRRRI